MVVLRQQNEKKNPFYFNRSIKYTLLHAIRIDNDVISGMQTNIFSIGLPRLPDWRHTIIIVIIITQYNYEQMSYVIPNIIILRTNTEKLTTCAKK
jgi:hypothetical protein